jgi:hypothetical protein
VRWAEKFEANNFPDKIKTKLVARRDGRVAEGARLESVYTLTGIGGSNPSLSASVLTPFINAQNSRTFGDEIAQACESA